MLTASLVIRSRQFCLQQLCSKKTLANEACDTYINAFSCCYCLMRRSGLLCDQNQVVVNPHGDGVGLQQGNDM